MGVGKEGCIVIVGGTWIGSARDSAYLEDYRPCAGGLSAANAIGAQVRDPINLGLD